MKKLISLVLVSLMVVTMFGCGKTETEPETTGPVTVTFWHTLTDQHLEALNEVIDGFNASQNEVIVVAEQKPYADFDSNLKMAVANGNGPDFGSMYQTNAADYIADDMLVDMTDYIVEAYGSMDAWKDALIGEAYNEATQFGATSFPLTLGSQVLFYNKDMFDVLGLEAPKTWDDVVTCAKAIKAAYPDAVPFTMDDELDDFQDIMTQKGYTYIDMDKKEIAWPKEATTELLQWYVDNCAAGLFQLKELGTYCSNGYAAGTTAMYTGSSAGASYACWGNTWDAIAPLPQAGTKAYAPNWGAGYVIFKTTEEKQAAAFKFLTYFAQAEVLAKWTVGFTTASAYKAAYETETYKNYVENNLAAKAMTAQADSIGWLSACIGSVDCRTAIQTMIRTAVNGEATVEQAVETFYTTANAALKG